MSRKGSRPVSTKKQTDKMFVGTITAEQIRKMQKASERQQRIESGVRQTGSGVHGGGKREVNRRERKSWKQDVRSQY
jgi:hypothetical protein